MAAAEEEAEVAAEAGREAVEEGGGSGATAAARNDAGRRGIAMFLCLFDSNMRNVLHWST